MGMDEKHLKTYKVGDIVWNDAPTERMEEL